MCKHSVASCGSQKGFAETSSTDWLVIFSQTSVCYFSEVCNVCVLVNVFSLSESGTVKQYPLAVDNIPSYTNEEDLLALLRVYLYTGEWMILHALFYVRDFSILLLAVAYQNQCPLI